MVRLKDRNKQIPHGLKFKQPEIRWDSVPWSSFDTIVRMLMQVRRANPFHQKKNNWALDYQTVANEVDAYNAAICAAHGWTDFITDTGSDIPIPKAPARNLSVARVVAGANVIKEMFGGEGPVTDKGLVNSRAAVCVTCPKNEKGDWTRFFTLPAQLVVRKTLSAVRDMDLRTDYDDQLAVCVACGCPLKGKVWARIGHIMKHIPEEDFAKLPDFCWIRKESAAG